MQHELTSFDPPECYQTSTHFTEQETNAEDEVAQFQATQGEEAGFEHTDQLQDLCPFVTAPCLPPFLPFNPIISPLHSLFLSFSFSAFSLSF